MIEITPLFPTFFGKVKFNEHKKYKNIFNSLNLKNINANQPRNWNSVVHTSFDSNEKFNTEDLKSDIEKFLLRHLDIQNLEINSFWYNIYKKGFYQEKHNHCDYGNFLSGIYFYKNPTSPVFVNSSDGIISSMGYGTVFSNTFVSKLRPNNFSPFVEEGDIIIFPSDLEHYVPLYNSDDPRITFSFNLGVKNDKDKGRRCKIW